MDKYYLCYVQVNVICMVLSAIVFFRTNRTNSIRTTSQMIMNYLIIALWMMCIADIVAITCRGQFFNGARALIMISNLLYLVMIPAISFIWLLYVANKVGRKMTWWEVLLHAIPVIAFAVLAITNPFNGFLFTIDADNLYQRGPGVVVHWIVSWFYVIYAGVLNIVAIRREKNWSRREDYKPLLYFLILPTIACVFQMLLPGINSVQVGVTIAIIFILMQNQDNRTTVDELTGINNRKAMRRHVEALIFRPVVYPITVFMIDVNRFKQINDTLGHATGDVALREVANILRTVCGKTTENIFLCRYGGDEFVMIAKQLEEGGAERVQQLIYEEVSASADESKPYKLEVSVGYAEGDCSSYKTFTEIFNRADEAMYEVKKSMNAVRE